jgi:hypothetical protein
MCPHVFQFLIDLKSSEPIIGSLENDTSQIYSHAAESTEMPLPVPPATALVDAAIDLFSHMVLDQPSKIQESAFAQIAAYLGDNVLTRNVGRKVAIKNNITIALAKALSNTVHSGLKVLSKNERVISLILDVLYVIPIRCHVINVKGLSTRSRCICSSRCGGYDRSP